MIRKTRATSLNLQLRLIIGLAWVLGGICLVNALKPDDPKIPSGKVLPVFNIVNFQNTICPGNNGFNGTCYTASECEGRGGLSMGTCAEGYGVCCVFRLACGGTSADNCTYLVQPQFNSNTDLTANPCIYTICPKNPNNFNIAPPISGTQVTLANAATASTTTGGALGDCAQDMFTFSSMGNNRSPTICGLNTGQHMILDSSDSCNLVNFVIGGATALRSWSIKVTQYACYTREGGPPDCLQYFTGTTGVISTYNFDTSRDSVPLTGQHISSQCYTICIRRESGMCSICYSPAIDAANNKRPSFGLSASSSNTAVQSGVDTDCSTDYLFIPQGIKKNTGPLTGANQRFCGPIFAPTTDDESGTICTFADPFTISLKTDADEITGAGGMAKNNELIGPPAGTTGFSLFYEQMVC